MPANKIRGETTLKLNEAEYILRPTFQSLIDIENMTGRSAIEILGRFGQGRFAFADVVPAFYAFANAGGHELSYEECGDMTLEHGVEKIAPPVADCLVGALIPEEKTQAKEKN